MAPSVDLLISVLWLVKGLFTHERRDEFRPGIKVVPGRKIHCLHEQFHSGMPG